MDELDSERESERTLLSLWHPRGGAWSTRDSSVTRFGRSIAREMAYNASVKQEEPFLKAILENDVRQVYNIGYHAKLDTSFVIEGFLGQPSPLGWAAYAGKCDVMRALLVLCASVNYRDKLQGKTALHWACRGGHTAAVSLLLEKGAAHSIQDRHGLTPLIEAIIQDAPPSVIAGLLRAGTDVNLRSLSRLTALSHALCSARWPQSALLIAAGCEWNTDSGFWSPLANVIKHDREDIFDLLLAASDLSGEDWGRMVRTLPRKEFANSEFVFEKYEGKCRRVRSLQELTRVQVRKGLMSAGKVHNLVHRDIGTLPLPDRLKLFLLFSNRSGCVENKNLSCPWFFSGDENDGNAV